MIHFIVRGDHRPAVEFINLVNSVLPRGCSFTISPLPQFSSFSDTDAYSRDEWSGINGVRRTDSLVSPRTGIGYITGVPASGTRPGSTWNQTFAALLRAVLNSSNATILLTSNDPIVLGGQFRNSQPTANNGSAIDVADLRAFPPQFAAGAILHELNEQHQLQVLGVQAFPRAHSTALQAEAVVSGRRVVEFMSPESERTGEWHWWMWIQQGSRTRTLIIRVNGNRVVRSAYADKYRNQEEFEREARRFGMRPVGA